MPKQYSPEEDRHLWSGEQQLQVPFLYLVPGMWMPFTLYFLWKDLLSLKSQINAIHLLNVHTDLYSVRTLWNYHKIKVLMEFQKQRNRNVKRCILQCLWHSGYLRKCQEMDLVLIGEAAPCHCNLNGNLQLYYIITFSYLSKLGVLMLWHISMFALIVNSNIYFGISKKKSCALDSEWLDKVT